MPDTPTSGFVPRIAFPDVILGHLDTEEDLAPALLCRWCGGVWPIAADAQSLAAAGLALIARHLATHERPLPIGPSLIAAFGRLVH